METQLKILSVLNIWENQKKFTVYPCKGAMRKTRQEKTFLSF